MFSALFMTNSSSAPADPAAASSSARCRSDSESRRLWLRMALAIVMLSSACCVSMAQGTWSTAQLSVGRYELAATSVGNVAIFAGGWTGNCSFALFVEGMLYEVMRVGDAVTFECLRRAACCLLCMRCRRLPHHVIMCVTADFGYSKAVDLYNGASGTWSTAQLSVARASFAATSVGNVAIFAGGNCSFTLFVEGLLFGLMRVRDAVTFACLRRAACCLLCMRSRRLPSHGCHCRYRTCSTTFQSCGLVQRCIGHMVDCAAQCGAR
jgi:hypothetical protein